MTDQEPGVIPMLAYRDGPAAMDWLVSAFGFRERDRRMDESGRLTHGELDTGGGLVMLATPSPHYEGPALHRQHCETAARWQEVPYIVDGILVYIPDARAHFERARAAGARILSEPEEGSPRYRVEDLEGHRWYFMERG
jgi:uncharacterized glyoxalase superfamily protein PhnB